MNARILKPEEWGRLEGSGLPPLLAYAHPRNVAVVAVEDSGGELAACMSVLQVSHFEGVWVDPKHRGNPGVMRPLLRQAWAIPAANGEQWAIGAAAVGDEQMLGFLRRLGAPLSMELYAIKVGESECPQQ